MFSRLTLTALAVVVFTAGCTCGGVVRLGGGDGGSGSPGANDGSIGSDSGTPDSGAAADAGLGLPCTPGERETCFSGNASLPGTGICAAGKRTCIAGNEFGQWGSCENEVLPAVEICNGLDDDCNGLIDDAAGGCACINGRTQPCYRGPPGTQGVGVCRAGTQRCVNGQWDTCSGDQLPSAELCNAQDDDCNGQTDEGFGTVTCGSAQCTRTVNVCVGGVTQTCTPGTPSPEICNGLDDDCDGQVDEGLGTISCGAGLCARTVPSCLNGVMNVCSPGSPSQEICGNGIDEDCNGADLGCTCIRTPSLTPWQIHSGEAPTCWPQVFPTNGATGEYQYSTIPPETDPGWSPHAAPAISFSDPSTMCGQAGAPDLCTCRGGGDFTYFQTSFNIASGYTVTSLEVRIADVDDGVRVTLFNANHPAGVVGGYAFIGGGDVVTNLAPYVVSGANRVVLTHIDDCCQVRRIANATITLNGSALNPCP